ncbi:hypothetical protein DIE22_33465 [Burkholderia sp. Bp9142]|nr:hypothetical protein DIE22_33465 [Burkholderia sp. Bp9142]RQR43982.1 hypothetical protein DIE21_34570 [Burkholderia sp. Bp9140]
MRRAVATRRDGRPAAVCSTVGAGDSFVGGMVWALAGGVPLEGRGHAARRAGRHAGAGDAACAVRARSHRAPALRAGGGAVPRGGNGGATTKRVTRDVRLREEAAFS